MSHVAPATIIAEAEERLMELGTLGAMNLVEGIQEDEEFHRGKKLITLLEAYDGDIDDDEKESILYCLIQVSEKFVQPANTNGFDEEGSIGDLIQDTIDEEAEEDLEEQLADMVLIGEEDDVEDFFGEGDDTDDFIGA